MSVVAYHATTCERAKEIVESGVLRRGSYFAYHIEDALRFAGPVVFVGEFDESKFNNPDYEDEDGKWQFWLCQDFPLGEICKSHHWAQMEKKV